MSVKVNLSMIDEMGKETENNRSMTEQSSNYNPNYLTGTELYFCGDSILIIDFNSS
jgi:hypothetical protein